MEETIDVLNQMYTEPLYDYLGELKIGSKTINLDQVQGLVSLKDNELRVPFRISNGFEEVEKAFRSSDLALYPVEMLFVNYNRNVLLVTGTFCFKCIDLLDYGVATFVFECDESLGEIQFKIQTDVEEVPYFF